MQLSPYIPTVMDEDWIIGQSTRDINKYIVVIESDRSAKEVECIAVEWLAENEIQDAKAMHEGDYFGEFAYIPGDLDDPKAKEGMLAGKKCFGWFKLVKEEEE